MRVNRLLGALLLCGLALPACGVDDGTASGSAASTEDGGAPGACVAMDADAVGECMALLGFAFDGYVCQPLGGCSCEGTHCGYLYPTRTVCEQATGGCALCQPMDARGVGECMSYVGFAWDGTSCEPIGGCSCEGEDCGGLLPTRSECEAAHESCS